MIMHLLVRGLLPYTIVGMAFLTPAWLAGRQRDNSISSSRLLLYFIPFVAWIVGLSCRTMFIMSPIGGQGTSTLTNLTVEPLIVAVATVASLVPHLLIPADQRIGRRLALAVALMAVFGVVVGTAFPALPE